MSAAAKFGKRLKAVLEICGMALSSLSPRRSDLVLFGSWFGNRYDDNPRFLHEYAAGRPGVRCVWMTRSAQVRERLEAKGQEVCMMGTPKALGLLLRAGRVVYSVGPGDVGPLAAMGGAVIVNLWHGVPIKRVGALLEEKPSRFWDWIRRARSRLSRIYAFSTSEQVSQLYGRVFRLDQSHILDLGQSRTDYFFSDHLNPLRQAWPGKRIILYMPTFRQMGKQRRDMQSVLDHAALDAFCADRGVVFLIKEHYYVSPTDSERYENVVHVQDGAYSAQELLDAADILVTDYSSCFVDYLLLDRPQVFYAYDYDDYKDRDRDFIFDYSKTVPGRVCRSFDGLVQELDAILGGSDAFAGKRREMTDFYFSPSNRGPVAAKQLETILEL